MSLDLTEINKDSNQISGFIQLEVRNNEENSFAGQCLKICRERKSKIKDFFKSHKDNAYKSWKDLCSSENIEIEKVEKVESVIETRMKQFLMAERQKQIEAQRKADELAEKEAQKERDKLAKQVSKLESSGRFEEAEAKLQEAEMIIANAPIVQSRVEKQEGISGVAKWTFTIVNADLIPREYLIPDEKKIRAYVNAMKKDAKIPGVKVEEDISLRVKI